MDPHVSEYLAAIAGMNDVYGDRSEGRPEACPVSAADSVETFTAAGA